MVSSSCAAATACYALPILACAFYSLLSLLDRVDILPILQKLQRFFERDSAEPTRETHDGESPDPVVKAGQWPAMSVDFAKPSIGLLLWCCFPVLGYAVVRSLSGCEQWFCWQVEAQTASSHVRNLLHLLAASILLAWLCNIPPSTSRHRALFTSVAVCEFLINKAIWDNCEDYMAHSLSVGSTFGMFDIFIALTTILTLVVHTCEGLPCLRRCFQRLSQKLGMAANQPAESSEQHQQNEQSPHFPHLYLSAYGQRNYLIYLGLLVIFHGGLFMAFPDTIHAHHYWLGVVVASCCIFPTPLSRLMLLKSVMMAIDGIGVWGADAIVGKDDGNMSESDADYRLMLCVLVVGAFALAVCVNLRRDPRLNAWITAGQRQRATDTE
ncbi:unnamed protein product [Symbiodinium natans]|uniref:Transmembrane protein n=1 Tax=Symbiodinium natans TaxID=878477 RepID=A0A812K731_9DINO|nr:unnamed protein product [Symbiodinium natans]